MTAPLDDAALAALVTDDMVEAASEASHIAYEDAALRNGWETQERSRVPWSDVPEENKATVREAITAALNVVLPVTVAALVTRVREANHELAKANTEIYRLQGIAALKPNDLENEIAALRDGIRALADEWAEAGSPRELPVDFKLLNHAARLRAILGDNEGNPE